MIKPGFYPDLSSADYHADKNSISRSSLRDFYRSPKYYWAMHLNEDKPLRTPTRDMILGSAFHTMVLEEENWTKEYAVEPEKVLLKDEGREAYEEYKQKCYDLEITNKTVLTRHEHRTLKEMRSAVHSDNNICKLIYDGEIETSYFWQDPHSELILKSRPDVIHEAMVVDLKTIADASPESFQRAMVDGWYHVQAAMIRDAIREIEGREITTFVNVCVEKKYPYSIGVYIIDEAAIDHAETLYKNLLLDLKTCIVNNDFRDYKPQIIGLPKWAM